MLTKTQFQPPAAGASLRVKARGLDLLNDPWLNKGTSFTLEERDALGLRGLLPPHINDIEEQKQRVMENFRAKSDTLEK